jgi:hypothetical protein
MKKAIILAAVIVLSLYTMPAIGDSENIIITIDDYAEASIFLNETTWITVAPLGSNETKPFNIDNNGSVTVDIDVKATNTTEWNIKSSPSDSEFALRFNTTGGLVGTEEISYTDLPFYTGLTHVDDVDFVLTLYLPTTSAVATAQELTVTFTATAG